MTNQRRRLSGPLTLAFCVLVASTLACRKQAPAEILLGTRAATPAPSGTGSCDFDLDAARGDTVFFVLGMLNEYLGRGIVEDDDTVESFYCDETEKAQVFRRAILTLAEEQGVDSNIQDIHTQECLVSFHSQAIASRINSCYVYRASTGKFVHAPDGTYRRIANASLGMALFFPTTGGTGTVTASGLPDAVFHRRRALAYLAGAWSRYRRGDDFVFANARDKATLLANLLTNLGCHDVRLESSFGTTPQGNVIHFTPTVEVKEWLEKGWF